MERGLYTAKSAFIRHMLNDLDKNFRHNKKSVEQVAASYAIYNKTEIKEFTELAIVYKARSIAQSTLNSEAKYWEIVQLYQNQVNLSHRTSESILLQQYSTPAPIAFLAGIFVNADQE